MSSNRQVISNALDVATVRLEYGGDPATISAWSLVIQGLECAVEYEERFEQLERQLAGLSTDIETIAAEQTAVRYLVAGRHE